MGISESFNRPIWIDQSSIKFKRLKFHLLINNIDVKMIETTIDYTVEKFLITNEPVMELSMKVLHVLNKIGKITIKGKDESCPATVSVANIITQNVSNGTTKTEQISLDSETSDDGRMISTIEIIITKISA